MDEGIALPLALLPRILSWIGVSTIIFFISYAIYNLYLHPLAKYPGPLLWRLTRITYMRSMFSGWLHRDILEIHRKYGPVVRVAPDELSYTEPQIWQDIFTHSNGTPPFPKFEVWFKPPKGRAMSLLTALDPKEHARIRRALNPGFTEQAITRQEGIITGYVDTLISKLEEMCKGNSSGRETSVNIVRWYNYTIFDIIGDLGFGESFHCLEQEQYHPWMALIMGSFRASTLKAALRFYPDFGLDRIVRFFIPTKVTKDHAVHYKNTMDKVDRRLNLEQERPDLISLIERDFNSETKTKDGLSRAELEANAQIFVTAGSETTAITCCGITNHLVKTPRALSLLTDEIRASFNTVQEIRLEKLKKLPYLQAVLMEGFRMCNPTPIGTPHVVPPGGANVCGEHLPAGTVVNAFPLGLGMLRENFHDPHLFIPERWLEEARTDPSSPFFNDTRTAVNVFGVGARMCIAKNLASAELMLIIAKMVWSFNITEVDSLEGKLRWLDQQTFFVTQKRPFKIYLKLRD